MIAYSPFGSPDLPWGEKMPHILVDPVLKRIAHKYQRSTAQIVVRWLLQRGLATIPKVYTKIIYFFRQITTFIKIRMAFVFGLQTLKSKDFSNIYQLKGLKPKNFYECCAPN